MKQTISDSTSVSERVQEFLAHCKAAGLSPRTYRDAYGYPLNAVLVPFCELTLQDYVLSK